MIYNITILLKSLYRSLSIFIPKKIECIVKSIADVIPKKQFFLNGYNPFENAELYL